MGDSTSLVLVSPPRVKLVLKISILLSVVMLIAIVGAGYLSYTMNNDLMVKSLRNQVRLAANGLSLVVDGTKYQKLLGKLSVGSSEYQEVQEQISRFYQTNRHLGIDREGAYTLTKISDDSLMITAGLNDEMAGTRVPLRTEMNQVLSSGIPAYTDPGNGGKEAWVSGYAPIMNAQGDVVGIVQVDFNNTQYAFAQENQLYAILFVSLGGMVLAIIVAIVASRFITRPIERMSQAAIAFARGDMNQSVSVASHDEIGTLAEAFNAMIAGVRRKEAYKQKNVELETAYMELEKLNKSLHEATRVRSEFLSIAAHDLKNPLATIRGFAEMIHRESQPDSTHRQYAEFIENSSERMVNLIEDLLFTSALQSGKLKLEKEPLDLGELAYEVVEGNKPQAEKKSQQLAFTNAENCIIEGDRRRMFQVIDNLVSNAIKYSPKKKTIWITLTMGGKTARFDVRDEGQGLSDTDKQKLFKTFVKLSAKPTAGESSSGLGLSVVRKIVELHGGTVLAESIGQGQGSTFSFVIPLLPEQQADRQDGGS